LRDAERTALAFAAVIGLAELSPVIPHHPAPRVSWWLGGVAMTVAAAVVTAAVRFSPRARWLRYLPLALFLVAVQMLRAADGDGSSGFTPLLVLPVIWFALYGTRVGLCLALAGTACVQFIPLVVVGAPQYPETLWRGGVLWMIILTLIGLAAQQLVATIQNKSDALAASEDRFRTAFADAPTGVALVGATGAQTGVYLQVNRALAALLGRSVDELENLSVLDITHPEDRSLTEQELSAPPERQTARSVEKRYVHSNGADIPVRITYSRIRTGPQGDPCYVAHVEDATARRDAQLEILSALEQEGETIARLERLELRRAALITAAGGEAAAPVTGISRAAELLRTDAEHELTERQRGRLREIEHHAERLATIIAELVDASRQEAATPGSTPSPVEIDAVVRAAVDSIRPLADGRELAMQVEVDLAGARIDGEPAKIHRALMSVLDNAVKYTPPGGAIDVQARIEGDAAVVEVTDTGIGIHPDEQARIFDRFYRTHYATEHAIPGTGLGLTISKAITDQHHGTLEVFSEPGVGSTFKLALPLRQVDAFV
jgi:PAS domain S-box-containing protein